MQVFNITTAFRADSVPSPLKPNVNHLFMKLKQSIFPYVFGLLVSGFMILGWVLGKIGVIDTGVDVSIVSILFLPFAAIIFIVMALSLFFRAEIVIVRNNEIIMKSISLIPTKISLPKSGIREAKSVRLILDGENQAVRIFLKENNEQIKELRNKFKSCEWFGFKKDYFDCMIWGSSKRAEKVANLINNSISSG